MVEQIPMKKKTVRYAQQQNQEEKGLEEEKKSSERTFRRKCPGKKTGEFYTAILRPISNRASHPCSAPTVEPPARTLIMHFWEAFPMKIWLDPVSWTSPFGDWTDGVRY